MTPQTKHKLPDDHTIAIGSLVVATSWIDSLLTDLTSIFIGANILHTVVVVHHQQITSKIDNLRALFDLLFAGVIPDTFKEYMVEAEKVVKFRNTVVHSYWSIDETGRPTAVKFNARGKFSKKKTHYSAQEIQAYADAAYELAQHLTHFRDHMLSPSPLYIAQAHIDNIP